jgi:NarL family two-component system response regulator YdfI
VIRVLLSVSSPALRAGLRALLSSDKAIKVAASPDSLDEESEVDVMITSASPASLLHTSTSLSASNDSDSTSSAAILFLGGDPINIRVMKRLTRAWGILPPDSSAEELTAAVRALSQGLIVGASSLLFESDGEPVERGPLTDRELEVLGLLSRGLANKQIAVELGISEHTVKFHVSSIYTKLDVTNRTEAVRAGLRGGWIAL